MKAKKKSAFAKLIHPSLREELRCKERKEKLEIPLLVDEVRYERRSSAGSIQ
jgi:hypothetical protein